MSDFDSLTWALEKWFDTPLRDLPDGVRQRVEREFFPMPWDSISIDQRRSVALQLDYQHDPTTGQDRQFWWDFNMRRRDLEMKIAEWEGVSTPTADELIRKETRLSELRQELALMDMQERQALGDYYPEKTRPGGADTKSEATPPDGYVHYLTARALLMARLGATPQEIAMWIWHGKNNGGLDGYLRVPPQGSPPKFQFPFDPPAFEYVDSLMQCYFKQADLEEFGPGERFITYAQLLGRLEDRLTKREAIALIAAAGASGDLHGFHPVTGGVRGAGCWKDTEEFPPIEEGMFSLDAVQLIETTWFPGATSPAIHGLADAPIGSSEWRKQIAKSAANARHDQPGGSRDKQRQMREIWASGKYSSRDLCAEQECSALGMSFSAARKALINTPDP